MLLIFCDFFLSHFYKYSKYSFLYHFCVHIAFRYEIKVLCNNVLITNIKSFRFDNTNSPRSFNIQCPIKYYRGMKFLRVY